MEVHELSTSHKLNIVIPAPLKIELVKSIRVKEKLRSNPTCAAEKIKAGNTK